MKKKSLSFIAVLYSIFLFTNIGFCTPTKIVAAESINQLTVIVTDNDKHETRGLGKLGLIKKLIKYKKLLLKKRISQLQNGFGIPSFLH